MIRVGTAHVSLPDETIMSWFKARAFGDRGTVEEGRKAYAKQILSEVHKDLKKLGFTGDVTIKWDRYAGCSCGCSPGYVIKVSGHRSKTTWEALNKVKPQLRGNLINYSFYQDKLTRTAGEVKDSHMQRTKEYVRGSDGKLRSYRTKKSVSYPDWRAGEAQKELGLTPGKVKFLATTGNYFMVNKY